LPELPEVETVVRSLKPKIQNKIIKSVNVYWTKTLSTHTANSLSKTIQNKIISSISRRGKYIILQIGNSFLVIHLRMTGKLIYQNSSETQSSHLRLKINFKDNSELHFTDIRKFGRIEFHNNLNFLNEKLGIEPFSNQLTAGYLYQKLCKRNGPIKSILLNQSIIAGIGNIYADEILWKIRVHPQKPANQLDIQKLTKLISATQIILQKAINSMGTTIINFSFDKESYGNYGSQLKVFNKNGENCIRCSDIIIKTKCAGRGTYYCPTCQTM